MSMDVARRMQAARTDLILDHPFFGSLALLLRLEASTDIPTMATDGKSLIYNPAFVGTLSKLELLGVVAHEIMHCACGHPWRRGSREPMKFNIAADFAINFIVEEAGFKLPHGRLRSADFDGKSAEWIYDRLPSMKEVSTTGLPGSGAADVQDAPTGKGTGDGNQDGDGGSASGDDAPSEAEWKLAVQQAAQAAKARGKLPASLKRFADDVAEPVVDWRSVLRRFVQQQSRSDYSWTRPNRRHIARGVYLPEMRTEEMGPIAIAIDTSGSVDNVLLGQFQAEVQSIAAEMRPSSITVIYCDAKVQLVETFFPDDLVTLTLVGGGGTAFAPALDAADALEEEPVCLVYLTDLEGPHRLTPPSMPILWASTTKNDVPYGEVVLVER